MDLSWILETLPVALWVAHVPDGAVVYTNSEFRKIIGVDAAPGVPIEGAPGAYGIFDRAGRPYPVERLPFSRVVQTGLPVSVDDMVIHRPDGRQVNIRAFGYPAFSGTSALEHVGVAFVDITAEVRAEHERDQTLARLALAVNHAPIVIWSADRLGVVTLSEGAGLASLGVESGELVGTNIFELYKDHPTIAGYIRRGLGGESFEYTVEVGEVCFDTRLVPLRDSAGAVAGVTALSHDVSQVRKLQATAIQNDRAIALGTLASSVAHEINNPLTYVLGHLEVMAEELGVIDDALSGVGEAPRRELSMVSARMREALDTARSGTERIAGITRELGTFNRPSTDDRAAVDVLGVVSSVLKLVRKEVEARAQLQLSLHETAPVLGNTSRLVQVILNLVVNAMQALSDRQTGAAVWISTRNEDQEVVIEVADNGPGVARADREHIFEPFVTRKEVGKGTGLGLFVCRNIVEGFGGRVWVDERPGGGALFRVVLPAASALGLAERAETRTASQPGSPASAHVLIIDDDPAVAKLLEERLLRAGYEVTVETDAARALERLANGAAFELIYCDLMMQGMTGMDLAEALTVRAPTQLDHMLFMTGGAFSPRAQDFRNRHTARFVDKPFDIVAETRRRLRRD